jgi:hypothetical protein
MKEKMGEKARRILELHAEGRTPTEIMKETGYSLAWIREVIVRAEVEEMER